MHSNVLWAAFDNTESQLDGRERHIVGHDRLAQPFQRERADFFECYDPLDGDRYSLCDEDLSILGLRAKARGEIAHGADCSVTGAFGKADLAEGRVTLRDACAEPEQAAASAPAGN